VDRVLSTTSGGAVGPTGIIAGYRIDEQIGQGGMGVVYRATQLALDRPVAIKLIAAEKSGDPVFRERFKHESRLAASIEHPHVVPVFEAGEDDGLLFIAMRYVDGIDLGYYLRRGGAMSLEFAARLIAQLASALDAAHALDLVHRDVKPANVLLTTDAQPHAYLTDFGVAKQLAATTGLTQIDALVGTIDYMAPEQIRGEPTDSRADIYSLTALLYHCLTGEPPFPRDNEAARIFAHLNAPPPTPSAKRPGLPPELDAIISTGLEKRADERYATAGDLARAVGAAAGIELWSRQPEVIRRAAPRGATPSEAPTTVETFDTGQTVDTG
jgi:serine/threonine-protein kinase